MVFTTIWNVKYRRGVKIYDNLQQICGDIADYYETTTGTTEQ